MDDSFRDAFTIKMRQEINQMTRTASADRDLNGKKLITGHLTNPEEGEVRFVQLSVMTRDP